MVSPISLTCNPPGVYKFNRLWAQASKAAPSHSPLHTSRHFALRPLCLFPLSTRPPLPPTLRLQASLPLPHCPTPTHLSLLPPNAPIPPISLQHVYNALIHSYTPS